MYTFCAVLKNKKICMLFKNYFIRIIVGSLSNKLNGKYLTLYSAQRQDLVARTRQWSSADSRRSCRLTLRSPPAQSCISLGSSCRWFWDSQRSGPVVCQQSSAARKGSPEGRGSTGNTVGPQLMSILWIWSVGQLCFTECSVLSCLHSTSQGRRYFT